MLTKSTIQPSRVWHVDHERSPASRFLAKGLPCVFWCPACQGAGTPCLTRGRVCGVRGGGGAVAPAPVLGNYPQTHPRTPRVSLWDARGMGCGSIECVPLLEAAPAVVLPLPLGCLVCGVC